MNARTTGNYVNYIAGNRGVGELVIGDVSYGPRGGGAKMTYTVADSPFGRFMTAATEHGVCWLGIHEAPAYLEAELRRDYPDAQLRRDDDAISDIAARLKPWLGGETGDLHLPLDVRATPFQRAVWRELCSIPFGSTRSYGEIARTLGRPAAARAVGHANGSNPLAIVIPCHRAIGSNGTLTGYRWGLEYKRRLLEHEQALAQQVT
jgi:AraC family transcriptional regulator, regulatory protein of adaptative response / methylated-DNA-[protein]-cysteine methyltransferase